MLASIALVAVGHNVGVLLPRPLGQQPFDLPWILQRRLSQIRPNAQMILSHPLLLATSSNGWMEQCFTALLSAMIPYQLLGKPRSSMLQVNENNTCSSYYECVTIVCFSI